ncbi:alanine aminotransferase 2-like [Betta splendens]|uniref:alanine transaminase n=1 Tax=Betta splendens TaxID=158456 RepID=A0A6P7MDA2_BETSP|nr:alanine aminotransferase 2-like [Betta splendens]
MCSLQHVNPRVRGIGDSPQSALQRLAADLTRQLTQGAQKPFKRVIDVSSGDPHKAGMKPISFVRQVLSACLYPELLEDKSLPPDVKTRVHRLLETCDGGSVGSYSESSGLPHVRQSIAEFITRRDAGVPSYAKDIFICAGSQRALMIVVKLMASGEGDARTGVLIPTPCPHTLPPVLDEAGAVAVPYELMEERDWAVDLEELHRAVAAARGRCEPRALYISNPGNPTGHLQDRTSIEDVIRFAAAQKLVLLVDEVFQDSVFEAGREFISYKKALFDMDKEFSQTVELISFHSLSSACMGECGLRAAYMETVNMDPEVMTFVDTMLCGDITTPVTGQLALEVMTNPPRPGEPSHDTYTQEVRLVRATLVQNAQRACRILNDLPGMSCRPATGGIYLYPHLHLPPECVEQAKALQLEADVLYCQQLLAEEGVFVGVGGSARNHHLRLCVLVPSDTLDEVLARLASFHLRLMGRFLSD